MTDQQYQEARLMIQELQRDLLSGQTGSSASEHILFFDVPLADKYPCLQPGLLITDNSQEKDWLQKVITMLEVITMYACNLLKPEAKRPRAWRVVNTTNHVFSQKVDIIKGGRDLLKQLGYCNEWEDGLYFPDLLDPDPHYISGLLAEVRHVLVELRAYRDSSHPYPGHIQRAAGEASQEDWDHLYEGSGDHGTLTASGTEGCDTVVISSKTGIECHGRTDVQTVTKNSKDQNHKENMNSRETDSDPVVSVMSQENSRFHDTAVPSDQAGTLRHDESSQLQCENFDCTGDSGVDFGGAVISVEPDRVLELQRRQGELESFIGRTLSHDHFGETQPKAVTQVSMEGEQESVPVSKEYSIIARPGDVERDTEEKSVEEMRNEAERDEEERDEEKRSEEREVCEESQGHSDGVNPDDSNSKKGKKKGIINLFKAFKGLFSSPGSNMHIESPIFTPDDFNIEPCESVLEALGHGGVNRPPVQNLAVEAIPRIPWQQKWGEDQPGKQKKVIIPGKQVMTASPNELIDMLSDSDESDGDYADGCGFGPEDDIPMQPCPDCNFLNSADEKNCAVCGAKMPVHRDIYKRNTKNKKKKKSKQHLKKSTISRQSQSQNKDIEARDLTQTVQLEGELENEGGQMERDAEKVEPENHQQRRGSSSDSGEVFMDALQTMSDIKPMDVDDDSMDTTGSFVKIKTGKLKAAETGPSPEEQLEQEMRQMTEDGCATVDLLRSGEMHGYMATDVMYSRDHCGDQHPVNWLKENLSQMISRLIDTVNKQSGTDRTAVKRKKKPADQCKIFGEISTEEARQALRNADYDFDKAVDLCVKTRSEQIEAVQNDVEVDVKVIQQLLYGSCGNVEAVTKILTHRYTEQFLRNVWVGQEDQADVYTEDDSADMESVENHATPSLYNELTDDTLIKTITDKTVDFERRVRLGFIEGQLQGWLRAENLINILDEDLRFDEYLTLVDVVDAVKELGAISATRRLLKNRCDICYDHFHRKHIHTLSLCTCLLCTDCLKSHFQICVREKSASDLTCPGCNSPDMTDKALCEEQFNFLTLKLQNILDAADYQLLLQKVTDRQLKMRNDFLWCSYCSSGFILAGADLKVQCPNCQNFTCSKCKIQWEAAHDNRTCEEFRILKAEGQKGVPVQMQLGRLQCPNCSTQFALARGGCMHFTCPECRFQFCCGCNKPFKKHSDCKKFIKCRTKGLHCHHPRSCNYYLRDFSKEKLQRLLNMHQQRYETEALRDGEPEDSCLIIEQKEEKVKEKGKTVKKMKDAKCGKTVNRDQAGLCSKHYLEYLVLLINDSYLDPADVMETEELRTILQREEVDLPAREPQESQGRYRDRLLQTVKQELPLPQPVHVPGMEPRGQQIEVLDDVGMRDLHVEDQQWPVDEEPMVIEEPQVHPPLRPARVMAGRRIRQAKRRPARDRPAARGWAMPALEPRNRPGVFLDEDGY